MESQRPTDPDRLRPGGFTARHAVLIPAVLALCALGLAAIYLVLGRLDHLHPGLVHPDIFRFVNLTEEANLPTWFSALLWQIAALLAFLIAGRHRTSGWPHRFYWIGMVALFLFLSLDEAGKVHETIGDMISRRSESTGWREYTYSWVLFGVAFVTLVGLAYTRLLVRLRRPLAILFILSAAVFLLGAVVVESISAAAHKGSIDHLPFGQSWARMIAWEETLEMLGAILLIHTLLRILASDASPYRVRGATPARA